MTAAVDSAHRHRLSAARSARHDGGNLRRERRRRSDQLLADLANTTGEAFLGLTMSCCQCHDHKYDPLLQADHFRLRAFFAALKLEDEIADLHRPGTGRDRSAQPGRSTPNWPLRKRADALLAQGRDQVRGPSNAGAEAEVERRRRTQCAFRRRAQATRRAGRPNRQSRKAQRSKLPTGWCATDAGSQAPPPFTSFFKATCISRATKCLRAFFRSCDPNAAAIPALEVRQARPAGERPWPTGSPRRQSAHGPGDGQSHLATALWPGHRRHAERFRLQRRAADAPGAARLAGERVRRRAAGRSSTMHRLIVKSATYRQGAIRTSESEPKLQPSVDPENRLLWRQNPPARCRGPARCAVGRVGPTCSRRFRDRPVAGHSRDHPPQQPRDARRQRPLAELVRHDARRRHVRAQRSSRCRSVRFRMPFLQPFDLPDSTRSCARAMSPPSLRRRARCMNSPFAVAMAEALRRADWRTIRRGCRPRMWILHFGWPWSANLCRDEATAVPNFSLGSSRPKHTERGRTDPANDALIDLCRALSNCNEFIFID